MLSSLQCPPGTLTPTLAWLKLKQIECLTSITGAGQGESNHKLIVLMLLADASLER